MEMGLYKSSILITNVIQSTLVNTSKMKVESLFYNCSLFGIPGGTYARTKV